MKHCQYCGAEISEQATVCMGCGCPTQESKTTNHLQNIKDNLGCIQAIVCFIVPIIGFFFYFYWTDSHPKKARLSGIVALIGFLTPIVLTLLFWILYILFIIAFV